MLLDGINHVALLTDDIERFCEFYVGVFDAVVSHQIETPFGSLTFVDIGPKTELNVFALNEGDKPELVRGSMFTHGPIDHMGLQAADRDAFVEVRRRLMERGASDGFVTDFGVSHSVFFRDPDGLEGEVLLFLSRDNETFPPGTPAAGYD